MIRLWLGGEDRLLLESSCWDGSAEKFCNLLIAAPCGLLVKTDIPDLSRKLDDIGIQILDLSNQFVPGFIRVSIGTRDEKEPVKFGCGEGSFVVIRGRKEQDFKQ
jgi:hypothetical protein